MNNTRRKQLAKSIEKINEALEYVQNVLEEETEAFENMPEGIQESERGETMQECIDTLESIVSDFEDYVAQLEGYNMNESQIIVDIRYYGGSYQRIIAHSIEFEHREHWCLKVYDTQEDFNNHNPRLFWGVEKIKVVGYWR